MFGTALQISASCSVACKVVPWYYKKICDGRLAADVFI